MFTVALVGPDGSGKSNVSSRAVSAMQDLRFKRVYMGINLEASNLLLPSTRLLLMLKKAGGGKPDMAGPFEVSHERSPSKKPLKRLLSGIKSWALLAIRISEEWFRQAVTRYYSWRGYNVLFDRHFVLDYYYYDLEYNDGKKPLTRRIHGLLLKKYYPRPDLIIYLDAPAELLFQRKGEGTIASLEKRRNEYLKLREIFPAFSIVDASQPMDQVVGQVVEVIREYAKRKANHNQQGFAPTSTSGQWR